MGRGVVHGHQEISYAFVVTSTGDVPIRDVAIMEDSFCGSGEMTPPRCRDDEALAADSSMMRKSAYVLTQADVDAGQLTSTATAGGGSDGPIASEPADAQVPGEPGSRIGLEKSATPYVVSMPGEMVTYRFQVMKLGNVTLSDPQIVETGFTGSGGPLASFCPEGALAPGESLDCTAEYRVTQAEIDAGRIDNTVTATAVPPGGQEQPVSDELNATATIPPATGLALAKTSDMEAISEVG